MFDKKNWFWIGWHTFAIDILLVFVQYHAMITVEYLINVNTGYSTSDTMKFSPINSNMA